MQGIKSALAFAAFLTAASSAQAANISAADWGTTADGRKIQLFTLTGPNGLVEAGRDVVVAGDAAGVVAPSSGEGIYYAMDCARRVAQATHQALQTGNSNVLRISQCDHRAASHQPRIRNFLDSR